MFIPRNEFVNYPLRNLENNLAVPHTRTNHGNKRSFSYSVAPLWNSLLPLDLRHTGTLNSFKAKLGNATISISRRPCKAESCFIYYFNYVVFVKIPELSIYIL